MRLILLAVLAQAVALPEAPAAQPPVAEASPAVSLLPALTDPAATIHADDEAIGYELSGNAVLYQGAMKLVKNLPPYGDGGWHLFDINSDPGETRDLAAAQPGRLSAMQAQWQRWAKANRVLPMPAGYSAPAQIQANALHDLLAPRLAPIAAALWLLLVGVWTGRRWRAG